MKVRGIARINVPHNEGKAGEVVMSCEAFEAGAKVEAVQEIAVRVNLGAPVEGAGHTIQVGDIGEVTTVRRTGAGLHWLVIRWERLGRTFNLNPDQFDRIKIAG